MAFRLSWIPTRAASLPAMITKNSYKEYGIHQSMDGKRRWADNIMIERWFRSLKTEAIYPNEYTSPRELRQLIKVYVRDYNTIRSHKSLDYKVPNEVYYGAFANIAWRA